jgi:hypothetical protein
VVEAEGAPSVVLSKAEGGLWLIKLPGLDLAVESDVFWDLFLCLFLLS